MQVVDQERERRGVGADRLRSTSAWLRICTVATSATSSAMSQISIARPGRRRLAAGVLGGADMRNLQAGVVCRQLQVRAADHMKGDLKANLAVADVGQGGRLRERVKH